MKSTQTRIGGATRLFQFFSLEKREINGLHGMQAAKRTFDR